MKLRMHRIMQPCVAIHVQHVMAKAGQAYCTDRLSTNDVLFIVFYLFVFGARYIAIQNHVDTTSWLTRIET